MTRTLTLHAVVEFDHGSITLDCTNLDMEAEVGAPLSHLISLALGIDRVDHTDHAERVTDLAGTAERAPVVEAEPVDERPVTYTVDPPKAKAKRKAATAKAGRPTGPKSGPHAKGTFAAPGTALHAILDTIADHGGRWEGSAITLGAAAEPGGMPHGAAAKNVRTLTEAGLVTVEKAHAHQITAIALTGAGWAHLGRGKPGDMRRLVLTEPVPVADDDPARLKDGPLNLTPLPDRRVDHDAARAGAAAAL